MNKAIILRHPENSRKRGKLLPEQKKPRRGLSDISIHYEAIAIIQMRFPNMGGSL